MISDLDQIVGCHNNQRLPLTTDAVKVRESSAVGREKARKNASE